MGAPVVSQLSQVESGDGSARVSALYQLAVALGVPMKELFWELETPGLSQVNFSLRKRLTRRYGPVDAPAT